MSQNDVQTPEAWRKGVQKQLERIQAGINKLRDRALSADQLEKQVGELQAQVSVLQANIDGMETNIDAIETIINTRKRPWTEVQSRAPGTDSRVTKSPQPIGSAFHSIDHCLRAGNKDVQRLAQFGDEINRRARRR